MKTSVQSIGLLFAIVFLVSCAEIPRETPQLMRLNNQRLKELNKTYNNDAIAMRDHLDFIQSDLAAVVKELKELDSSCLDEANQKHLKQAISDAEYALDYLEPLLTHKVNRFPSKAQSSAESIVATYDIVTDILQSVVDDKELLRDLVNHAKNELGIETSNKESQK